MAEVRYIEIELEKIFLCKQGNSKYTKKYCNENKGVYEVYTGTTIGSFAFIDTYEYDERTLTYTTDGENAGTIKILNGKYNVGGHRAILLPKNENIVLDYFKWTLQKLFFDNVKKGDVPSISWSRIKDLSVLIPTDSKGNYDVIKQREIVKKYEIMEAKKKELKEKLDYFKGVQVDFSNHGSSSSINVPFDELFDIERGKVISRKHINDNNGDYPVFSTQVDSPFGYINSYMYDGQYLIWNTDGLGGYIRMVNGKFSITNIVGIMKLKKQYKAFVDLEYVKTILEPMFRENVKGREGVGGKNEYTKINSTMIKDLDIKINFPINEDGSFNIKKQKEIVSKYKSIETMKKAILEKGLPFTLSNVEFDGENPYIYIYIKIKNLFHIQRGKSIYTKTYCKNHKGDYPVYSADNQQPLGYQNHYDYDGSYLTSSINGIAGVLSILNGKFSANADRAVFLPKVSHINLNYVKHILEPMLRNKNKGRKGLNGKNEFTKLTPSMIGDEIIPLPYNIYGEPFIEKQNNIANKYQTIETIKKQMGEKLKELLTFDITF